MSAPEDGSHARPRRAVSLAAVMLVACGVLAAFVLLAVLSLRDSSTALERASDQRAAARLDLNAVNEVEKDVLDLETGLRGFVITRDEEFLQPWREARRRLPRDLASVQARLGADRELGPLAESLLSASTSYLLEYTQSVVAAVRAGRATSTLRTIAAEGKRLMDHIRETIGRLDATLSAEVARLTASADEEARAANQRGSATLIGSALFIVLFTALLLGPVVRPIRRVAAAADAVAGGDLTARAPEGGLREIARLAASFNDMAATIAEHRRAMDVRNLELTAAMEAAKSASEAKSEFLSRMSHELRTPLNAILGFGQLLQMEQLDSRQRDSLDEIVHGGRHLLHLIDDLLDISRLETGELRLSLEPIEATELIREALALIRPLADERSIELVADLTMADGAHVEADRHRLKQVLLNLLSNAIKYNREAGEVRVSVEPEDCERLVIRVSDTGAGLSRGQLDKLFEPFERLDAARKNIEGTGLGLSLSRRLVKAMDATLDVDSEPGRGSTFSIHLRAVQAPEPEPVEEPSPPSVQPLAGEVKILYIEDNLSNLQLVERVLSQQADVSFLPAMQGRLGLELARQHRPDMILLDLHLPDLRGDQVLSRLKAEPATRGTPVVVISADASPGQIRRLREAGAAEYLTKPIDLQELNDAVRRCLARPGLGAA